MRILLLDIESAPTTAYTWGLFQQNISTGQIIQSGYVLCWSAKWLDSDTLEFESIPKCGHRRMLEKMHKLLDQADAVVHYNGLKFDIPTLNKEFVKYGINPPSPYKNIDLYQAVKRLFRFESNKLDYVAESLGLGNKVRHSGFELWINCMHGDKQAWQEMETYNRQDVVLLEKLYLHLLPWLNNHPNRSVYEQATCCPNCGSKKYQRRGKAITRSQHYKRYQCRDCGHWFRGERKTQEPADVMRHIN